MQNNHTNLIRLEKFHYNSPFEDNHLLLKYGKEKSLMLFDLGDISKIPIRQILNIKAVFITHFHMDHIIGLHALLRTLSGKKNHTLTFYGPANTIEKIGHAIQCYEWNLLDNNCLLIEIVELGNVSYCLKPAPFHTITSDYIKTHKELREASFELIKTPSYSVEYCALDHKIPVLGYKIHCPIGIKTKPDKINQYQKGSWIKELQQLVLKDPLSTNVYEFPNGEKKSIKEISNDLFFFIEPYTVCYLTDFILHKDNLTVLDSFLSSQSELIIESHFLAKDQLLANKTYHLTTKDVAQILKRYNISKYTLIHFSNRYLRNHRIADFYEETKIFYSQI